MKKIISLIIAVFVLVSFASAIGVTYPHPQNIELTPEQQSYFSFQIQSDDFPIVCVPNVEDDAGLELAFNQQYTIGANQKFNVKPQVIVPKQTPIGEYRAVFCIECSPSAESEGSRIIPKICNLPITVNVVSERTNPNMFEEEKSYLTVWITFLIVAIVILVLIIFYLVRRRSALSRTKQR